MQITFVHINIIAENWKTLASFYKTVFSCVEILPTRKLSGNWLEEGSGVRRPQLEGIHLRLPGYGNNGPTLEIFSYAKMENNSNPLPNRKGFGHIAFLVDDVEKMSQKICKNGGTLLGKISQKQVEGVGLLTFVYCTDPEGNIIEIQNWEKNGG